MIKHQVNQIADIETTSGLLLDELQKIWDDVGESVANRNVMLLEIEQKCLEAYERKVDVAKRRKAQLQQEIAECEAELADICSAMGEQPLRFDCKSGGGLKKELGTIISQVEDMRKLKIDRKNQFAEVLQHIQNILNEFSEVSEDYHYNGIVDETDLSMRRLEELRQQLIELENQKRNRLKQVVDHLDTLNSLCLVLGMDFRETVDEIHPTLSDPKGTKDIRNCTIEKLDAEVQGLREVKIHRMQRLRNLGSALLQMWDLMDTPMEERRVFQDVASNIVASELQITEPNVLSVNFLSNVEAEVSRLEQLKFSKMKDLVIRKRSELKQICNQTHMIPAAPGVIDSSVEDMESGAVDPMYLLEQIEIQIGKVKEEALCRKEILEKVEKWIAACQEESWLEEYNRDDTRYNGGRGAHVILKRAEKARVLVNKIPAMVEVLTSKTKAWEEERRIEFLYDGGRILSMLEQYSILRQEKELEMQKQRDRKKIEGQLIAKQEALFGSKPSPSKSGKKPSRTPTGVASNRRLSLSGTILQNPKAEKAASRLQPGRKGELLNQKSSLSHQQHIAKRIPDIPGHPVQKQSSGGAKAHKKESQWIRKPLSAVSSQLSSKANIDNFLEGQKSTGAVYTRQALPSSVSEMRTPSKPIAVGDEVSRTPKTMPIPVPSTPPTVSLPMTTARTPATPFLSPGIDVAENNNHQSTEYSFEEVRAGFNLPQIFSH